MAQGQIETQVVRVLKDKFFHRFFVSNDQFSYNFLQKFDSVGLGLQSGEKLCKNCLDRLSQELVSLIQIDEAARERYYCVCIGLCALLVRFTFDQCRQTHKLTESQRIDLWVLHGRCRLCLLFHVPDQFNCVDLSFESSYDFNRG